MRALVFLILASWLLGACSTPSAGPTPARLPRQIATCPDPAGRHALGEGSTYRDMARARAEAVTGWEACHTAAAENGRS